MSRLSCLIRLTGMKNIGTTRIWLAVIVLAHLAVSILHGSAHTTAQVALSPAAMAFVFSIVLAGPLIGLGLMLLSARLGSWIVACTMAGALIFGAVNHFVLTSPDHVAHVEAQARSFFAATAVLLALTEAAGLGLAVASARVRRSV